MGLQLSFELSDRDLLYFRESLRQSREAVRDAEETEIVDAVRHVLEEIRGNEPLPDFVAERLPQLDLLIQIPFGRVQALKFGATLYRDVLAQLQQPKLLIQFVGLGPKERERAADQCAGQDHADEGDLGLADRQVRIRGGADRDCTDPTTL